MATSKHVRKIYIFVFCGEDHALKTVLSAHRYKSQSKRQTRSIKYRFQGMARRFQGGHRMPILEDKFYYIPNTREGITEYVRGQILNFSLLLLDNVLLVRQCCIYTE